ncbi:MAG: esterase-like activity of phytase family protein [Pseudomonadota bacterium]|nr:esterase-like activity of phytase family protein [Pseudomonadota bacterium]
MVVLLILGLACRPLAGPTASSDPRMTVSLLPATLRGLSGLTVDEAGRLWAVTEREPTLVPLRLDGNRVVEDGAPIPVAGWRVGSKDAVDAESIAWVGPGRFALGAEPRWTGDRDNDSVIEVSLLNGVATVTGAREVPYAPFAVRAEANRGLEGLAATLDVLVASAETVVTTGSGRDALLWRVPRDGVVTTARLRLTSATGKLSDIAARDDGAVTHLLAIERHYEVSRLVAADVTWGRAEASPARVVRDLGAVLAPVPNLEGIAWLADGRVVLIADNDSGERPGPVVAVVIAGLDP